MGIGDRLRRLLRRGQGSRHGLDSLGSGDIRDIVEESLEETEATSEIVERAQHAHDRARDLMRQGLFEEALERFRESTESWEAQAQMCRELGFSNMWKSKPQQVGREMENLRITHLDIMDLESFSLLKRRARLRRSQLSQVLEMAGGEEGTTESDIYESYPPDQKEDIRSLLFQAQRRGWITREKLAGHYHLRKGASAPSITSED